MSSEATKSCSLRVESNTFTASVIQSAKNNNAFSQFDEQGHSSLRSN